MSKRDIEFVNSVYDAVLDPRGLDVVVDFIRTSLRGSTAVMKLIDAGVIYKVVSSNVPERVLTLYTEYYSSVDPLMQAGLDQCGIGKAARPTSLVPEQAYLNSEFFVDFAKPAGTVHMLGGALAVGASRLALLALHRPHGDPDFHDRDLATLQRLLGPAGAALKLKERLGQIAGTGFAALEALAFGAVVCDSAGRLVFANGAAEALAGPGGGIVLGSRHGGVAAALPGEESRLALLVRDAAETARAGAMAVTGASGNKLFLLVTPLPRAFGQASQLVLITMRLADGSPLADPATLMSIFGLTAAEARVGAALSTGASVGEIATQSGVSEATVRTQVKRLLAKTGAESQREFVAMLGLLPPVKAFAAEAAG